MLQGFEDNVLTSCIAPLNSLLVTAKPRGQGEVHGPIDLGLHRQLSVEGVELVVSTLILPRSRPSPPARGRMPPGFRSRNPRFPALRQTLLTVVSRWRSHLRLLRGGPTWRKLDVSQEVIARADLVWTWCVILERPRRKLICPVAVPLQRRMTSVMASCSRTTSGHWH